MLSRINKNDQILAKLYELAFNFLVLPVNLSHNWHLSAHLLIHINQQHTAIHLVFKTNKNYKNL